MSISYIRDMTDGNEVSLLVKFSLPMLIGNIFQQFYNLIDSVIVGKFVGANVLAAVGATGSLNLLKAEHVKVNWPIITKCIKIGIPVVAQGSLIALSCVALQSVVNGFGEIAVAAFTTTSRIEQIVQQPFNSLGAAMATFSGQNIGANKLERVKRGYHRSVAMVAVFSILTLLIAQFGGRAIMMIFVKDKSVIALGAMAIKITSCAYFPLGMIYITRGLLNGAGDAIYAMANGMVDVIGRVGFSTILAMIPAFGVWSVWWTTGLTWLITAAISVIRYR